MTVGDIPPADNKPAGPRPEGTHWTEARRELREWLKRNAPSLAELYQGAVSMLYEHLLPGRVRFIAHAVREIGNRLPDYISQTTVNGGLQYKNRLDQIEEAWRSHGQTLEVGSVGSPRLPGSDSLPPPEISVPNSLYVLLAELIRDHAATREKPLDAAIRLFEGCGPENREQRDALRPVAVQWVKTIKWFVRKAHDSGSGEVDAHCDWNEFRNQFELFETTLGALVRGFFTTVEGLDDILEDTNN